MHNTDINNRVRSPVRDSLYNRHIRHRSCRAYLSHLVKRREDLRNRQILDAVWRLAQSKFAIMDGSGYVATVGTFLNRDGLLFSNASFQGWRAR